MGSEHFCTHHQHEATCSGFEDEVISCSNLPIGSFAFLIALVVRREDLYSRRLSTSLTDSMAYKVQHVAQLTGVSISEICVYSDPFFWQKVSFLCWVFGQDRSLLPVRMTKDCYYDTKVTWISVRPHPRLLEASFNVGGLLVFAKSSRRCNL